MLSIATLGCLSGSSIGVSMASASSDGGFAFRGCNASYVGFGFPGFPGSVTLGTMDSSESFNFVMDISSSMVSFGFSRRGGLTAF